MKRYTLISFASLLACALMPAAFAVGAAKPMLYVYNGPESASDRRYVYHAEVLRVALQITVAEFGPFVLKSATAMNDSRMESELDSDRGHLTVLIRGDTKETMDRFAAARIPIDKGMLGYRVLLIHRDSQPLWDQVYNLKDLQHFSIGQGALWKDNEILAHNALKVITGNSYDGLFQMLANKRFDGFSRGVEEIVEEYDTHHEKYPELTIEKNLLVHYPMARFFWFSKSKEGQKLLQRVEQGLTKMLNDGSFEVLFDRYHKSMLERLNIRSRRLIRLENPFASVTLHGGESRWWFSPAEN